MKGAACIHIVDDDDSLRNALSRLLRLHGYRTEEYASAGDFLMKKSSNDPGCVLLDISMPGPSGLELQEVLSAQADPPPVIFVTGQGNIPSTVRAMRTGAVDFLTKPVKSTELLQAIESALALGEAQRKQNLERKVNCDRFAKLTERERQVLQGVMRGKLNKQIAYDLGTSERTIKAHRAHVMEKMEVKSLAELIRATDGLVSLNGEDAGVERQG